MALTQYCELDEVRAALGVNEVELPNAVLNLPVYEIGLVRELSKISASLPAAFSSTLATPLATRTEAQSAFFDAARLFCVYACARQVGVSLGAMAPKSVGDGKASLSRFSDSPYKDVLARVEAMCSGARENLAEAYGTLTSSTAAVASTVPATAFRASARATDVVTGS